MKQRFLKLTLYFGYLLLLSSCAVSPTHTGTELTEIRKNDAIGKMLEKDSSESPEPKKERKALSESRSPSDIEKLTIDEVIRIEEPNTANLYDNSRYDFPITMNSRVEGWIDYFTGKGREHMERYLSRSSRYIPMMKQIFKNAGMPEDLVYLALIESGFNLRAKSRARAVGPWQFMKATGKRYGLRVDAWIDERRDPILSTEAAANYLKDLYLMFESWYLAASAYNAGEYKILRAIDELKTNNYWRICDTRLLRRETKDYIPKLIAAAIIAKNAKKYGFEDVSYQDPLEFETISVDKPVKLKELARSLDVSEDDMLDLNAGYARGMIPPHGAPYEIRVPTGKRSLAQRSLTSGTAGVASSELPHQYKVLAGDTINGVSNKYRIRSRDLMNANNLSPREKLLPGSVLIIPQKGAEIRTASSSNPKAKRVLSSQEGADGFVIHTVKPGESLWSISIDYDVTVQNIFRWNGLKKSSIHPGRQLKIKARKNVDSKNAISRQARSKS